MIKKYFFVLLLSHLIYSQNSKVFEGVLLDKIENKAISYAHFQSPQGGFISNQEGKYEFEVDDSIDSLQVFISAIGYTSKSAFLSSTKKNTVYLKPVEVNLEEVVLDYENPARQLIKKVIENIPKNYPNEFELLYGEINENTFWDSLKTKPIYKANVSIRADKFSYAKKSTIGNIELRHKNIIYHSFDSLDIRFYAGAHRVHYGDFVKARKDILSKNKVRDFEISINDTLSFNNKKVAILFYKNNQVNGIVYVDLENYAIVRVERLIEPLFIKEPFGFSLRYQRYYYKEVIDYSKGIGDKWRINFMYYTTGFKHKKKEREIHLENTYFLQRIEKGKEAISLNRRIKFTDVLINKIKLDSVESISKRDRLFRFFDRLRTSVSLSLIPVRINLH